MALRQVASQADWVLAGAAALVVAGAEVSGAGVEDSLQAARVASAASSREPVLIVFIFDAPEYWIPAFTGMTAWRMPCMDVRSPLDSRVRGNDDDEPDCGSTINASGNQGLAPRTATA
jgi:hypothetical protein